MKTEKSQRTEIGKALGVVLIPVLIVYLVVCSALYAGQTDILYPMARDIRQNVPQGWKRLELNVEGAGMVEAFYRQPKPDKPIIIFLHGNGGGIDTTIVATRAYADDGYGILMPEYPGYWGNQGNPSQAALDASAEAGMTWLANQGISR